jgi:hypothetical protein
MATNLALSNVFAANLQNSTKMLGMLHGSYGIGGTIGPISMYTFRVNPFIHWATRLPVLY